MYHSVLPSNTKKITYFTQSKHFLLPVDKFLSHINRYMQINNNQTFSWILDVFVCVKR